jgi:hypothetical protein
MTLWEQRNNSLDVQQKELTRIIKLAREEYGIRDNSIGVPVGKIEEFLHQEYYEKDGISPSDVATFIYKAYFNWSNKGIILLIETAEPSEDNKKNYSSLKASDLRERFGEICLFRFLTYDMVSIVDKHIGSYGMSEITTRLSTFDQSRFFLTDELSNVPCLFIREVDLKEAPRDTNDCITLLDSILLNRMRYNKPTIISLSVLAEKFPTPEKFGKRFSNIIQTVDRNKVFKIRLK